MKIIYVHCGEEICLVIYNNSTRPKKGKKQTKPKNRLPVKPVPVALPLNHVEVPRWSSQALMVIGPRNGC